MIGSTTQDADTSAAETVNNSSLPDSSNLVRAMTDFAEGIPNDKREKIGRDMLEALENHRKVVNKIRKKQG